MAEATPKPPAVSTEPKKLTLKQIVDDKELGRGFNIWLEGQKKPELAVKLMTNKLEAADLDALAGERAAFVERRQQAAEIKTGLGDKEVLRIFMGRFPELGRLGELVGEDGLREAIAATVDKTALSPDDAHAELYKIYQGWHEARAKYAVAKQAVEGLLKDSRLTKEEAAAVGAIGDAKARDVKIKEFLIGKNEGPTQDKGFWLWKNKDWSPEQLKLIEADAAKFSDIVVAGETKSGAQKMRELEQMLAEYGTVERDTVLSLAFYCSNQGAEEIGRIITGEKPKESGAMSFKELRQEVEKNTSAQKLQDDFYATADDSFADYITANNFDLNDDNQLFAAKNGFFQDFIDRKKNQAMAVRGGVWAAVYKAVIQPFVDEFMPELQNATRVDKTNKKLLPKKKK